MDEKEQLIRKTLKSAMIAGAVIGVITVAGLLLIWSPLWFPAIKPIVCN